MRTAENRFADWWFPFSFLLFLWYLYCNFRVRKETDASSWNTKTDAQNVKEGTKWCTMTTKTMTRYCCRARQWERIANETQSAIQPNENILELDSKMSSLLSSLSIFHSVFHMYGALAAAPAVRRRADNKQLDAEECYFFLAQLSDEYRSSLTTQASTRMKRNVRERKIANNELCINEHQQYDDMIHLCRWKYMRIFFTYTLTLRR